MRNAFFLLCFLLIGFIGYSQNETNDLIRLTDSAIVIRANAYMKAYEDDLKKDNKSENWRSHLEDFKEMLDNLYLVDESNNPYLLLSTNCKLDFKRISIYDKKNKKVLKKGVNVWKVFRRLENRKFIVEIIDFLVKYEPNNYVFSNGGGSKYIYEFNCFENKWILVDSINKRL